MALVQHLGTGRRKTSVARIFLRSGKGTITVNGRTFEHYVVNESARAMVRQPLLATEIAETAEQDKTALFVGPKRHAQKAIAEEAARCSKYYLNQRWLGRMLTNMLT